jgi:hypothetical protein
MNKSDKYDEDILRQYIDTERIEKAPENFTQTVMTRIRLESEPLEAKGRLRIKNIVPVVSVIITLILIIIAYISPGSSSESLPLIRLIQNIEFPVLRINFDTILNQDLSVWITYIFVGILLLGLFDRALSGLFHRD